MDIVTPVIDNIILRIHAAPLEPHGWNAVAKDLLALCRAERAVMLRVGLTPAVKPWSLPLEFDPAALNEYALHWAPLDLLYLETLRQGRIKAGVVSTEDQVIDRGEYLSSPYFNEFLLRHDIERQINVCLTEPLPRLGLGPSAVTLYRGIGKEAFGPAEAGILQCLAPHISIAARTTWRLEQLKLNDPIFRGALDTINEALVLVDAKGKLIFSNSAAENYIRRGEWVTVTDGQLTTATEVIEASTFTLALAKLGNGIGNTVLLTSSTTRKRLILVTVPISREMNIHGARDLVAGIVWLVSSEIEMSPANRLAKLFELTRAEERLLQRLVAGDSLQGAAAVLQVSIHTARNQLKAIFRKTGRRTQGQLLSLASRMAAIQTTARPW